MSTMADHLAELKKKNKGSINIKLVSGDILVGRVSQVGNDLFAFEIDPKSSVNMSYTVQIPFSAVAFITETQIGNS